MHDAEGVSYFSAHADKKAVLDFCIMHGKENRKMCFPSIASPPGIFILDGLIGLF